MYTYYLIYVQNNIYVYIYIYIKSSMQKDNIKTHRGYGQSLIHPI